MYYIDGKFKNVVILQNLWFIYKFINSLQKIYLVYCYKKVFLFQKNPKYRSIVAEKKVLLEKIQNTDKKFHYADLLLQKIFLLNYYYIY
jgi:hypothetical protein